MSDQYILAEDGKTPLRCDDLNFWGAWMQKTKRHVAVDKTPNGRVSTVFLGLNHSWDDGPPLLWETMVFDGPMDGDQVRYTSYEDAVAGHAEMLAKVVALTSPDPEPQAGGEGRAE